MDSKGKKIGILLVLCTLLLVMAAVVLVNYNKLVGNSSGTVSNNSTDSNTKQIIEEDGKVHGADLSAFMKDNDFLMLRCRRTPIKLHMMRWTRTAKQYEI